MAQLPDKKTDIMRPAQSVDSFAAAPSVLEINLKALAANYELIRSKTKAPCVTSGVVKADGYGLGSIEVTGALYQQGCRHFYVAMPEEALILRNAFPDIHIYVFGGVYAGTEELYVTENITPVLNSLEEIKRWRDYAVTIGKKLPALIHIDTAMNRLGLDRRELDQFYENPAEYTDGLDILYVISHFASAEERDNPLNQQQYERFCAATNRMGNFKRCLANSGGVFLSPDYHFDMVRPGMSLYGLNPIAGEDNPMQQVAQLKTRILQCRTAEKGDTVGYNATYVFDKEAKIATVAMGYADGILRTLSNNGTFFWHGIPCPVRGRVSMDLITIEITHLYDQDVPPPVAGDFMELLGPHQRADDLAAAAKTIGYEILTSLGARYARSYIG